MTRSVIIVFTLLLAGCEYEDSRAISSKIIIKNIISDEQPDGRTIGLSFCTEAILPQPQPIIYDASITGNQISIEFKGLDYDVITITMPAPGSCYVKLGYLKEGSYDLEFINGDHRDFGTMIVSKSDVSVDTPRPDGVEVIENFWPR